MDEKVRQGDLYDYYSNLLTEHQKSIYEEYVLDDLSLGEIAENHDISRQAVHDLIKRCTKEMEKYEEKLHLVESSKKRTESLSSIHNYLESLPQNEERDSAIQILKSMMEES